MTDTAKVAARAVEAVDDGALVTLLQRMVRIGPLGYSAVPVASPGVIADVREGGVGRRGRAPK